MTLDFIYVISDPDNTVPKLALSAGEAITALAAEGIDAQDANETINDMRPGEVVEYGSTTILCTWPAD